MLLILVAGAVLGGWALLSVFGGERQRLLAEIDARRPRPAPGPTSPPPASSAPPGTSTTPPAPPSPRRAGGAGRNAR